MRNALAMMALLAAAHSVAPGSASAADQTPDEAQLRDYASGAGPAGIFRYGRDPDNGYDVFGVVDPVYWRIRFYTVEDVRPGRSLSDRVKEKGDCLLPPPFRLWRVHQHPDRIVLQSQPEVTEAQLLDEKSRFTHRKITLSTDQASVLASVTGGVTDETRKPGRVCGGVNDFDAELAKFDVDRDPSIEIRGGEHTAFTFLRRTLSTAAPAFLRKQLVLARPGHYLASAQELEFATTGDAIQRHFLVTSRVTGGGENRAGFITPVVTIVRKGSAPGADRAMRLNLGLTRVKAGQKFVAVTSAGEVLLIGGADKEHFKFYSCIFAADSKTTTRCTTGSEPWDAAANQDSLGNQNGYATGKSKNGRWQESVQLANRSFFVDAGQLKESGRCLSVSPCSLGVGGLVWLPPMELRLAAGVRRRIGVPYAQSSADDGRPWTGEEATAFEGQGASTAKPIPLKALRDGRAYIFGDIENRENLVDSKNVSVFGIDCSALISQMWRRERLTTYEYVDKANSGDVQRVASIGLAKMDDAFVINVKDTLNHIVLFRESRLAGKFDSSRAILVLESSSTCGGMCFSFYDESFFQGWAIIRNGSGKSDFDQIPHDLATWKNMFAK